MIKSKREFAEWLNRPAIVYKKGSRGAESYEFDRLADFLVLETYARKEGLGMNNSANNHIYKVINGMLKHFYSEYYGFHITIKYRK